MSRLAADDSAALEAIMNRYERTVLNTSYRFLGDAQWAEEVAQDVFVSIYQQRHRYQSRGRFSTWLFRFVKNRTSIFLLTPESASSGRLTSNAKKKAR